ncbi:GTP pyrophosphokinase [Lentilactobacillus senioris]|uniref:GTP pyrophosphokinase n=1 Tax=Lentilactobacillus senioris TaxID=931534 RepID=UPI003D29C203
MVDKNKSDLHPQPHRIVDDLPSELNTGAAVKEVLNLTQKFDGEFKIRYQTALDLIVAKLRFIDRSYQLEHEVTLIDSVQSRIKSPDSIVEKMERKQLNFATDRIANYIRDIAGVRVITRFISDIETMHRLIKNQPDIQVVTEKDYVTHPKANGYRSLHLIVEVPVYLNTGEERIPVEIQIRTIGMNFWASLEHELNYKKDIPNKEQLRADLTRKAHDITQLDEEMDELRAKIRK